MQRGEFGRVRRAPSRRSLGAVVGAGLLAMLGLAQALPASERAVAEADARPALASQRAERSVLQAVTRAGDRLVAVGERGLVLLSDDGGASWRQASVPVSVTLTAVNFPTPRHGWAVGHFGTVLHSADGGETWQRQLDGATAAKLTVDAVTAAAAASDDPAAARRVAEAERLVADGPDKPLLDLHFADAQHGIVVGAYNLIFRTDDGGKNWRSLAAQVDNPGGRHLYAIRAAGRQLYLAGEQGLVLRADDGGEHFQRVKTPYQGSYFTLAGNAAGEVVVAGLRGKAFRSADGGASWEALAVPAPVSIVASTLDGDGRLLLANQAGEIYASADMGRSLAPLAQPALPSVTGLAALPGGALLATTLQGIARAPAASR